VATRGRFHAFKSEISSSKVKCHQKFFIETPKFVVLRDFSNLKQKLFHGYMSAKTWGDTEIAERGRSVLVMRARYRSAGLTPHQRGWTDAG